MAMQHPIFDSLAEIDAALKAVADVDPIYLSVEEKAEALRRLEPELDRLTELKLRVMSSASDVAEQHGARSVGAWLAVETGQWPAEGRRSDRLAAALERHPAVRRALVDGRASLAQAQVVCASVERLPAELGVDVIEQAEAHLVGLCDEFGPRQLKVLGDRVLEVVAPDVADAEEERRLRDEEAAAHDATRLAMVERGDGTTRIAATIPTSTAAVFSAHLQAFTSPRRLRDGIDSATGARLPHARQLGEAFRSWIERLPSSVLPGHGGSAVSVVATVELDKLLTGVGPATLTTGERVSAGEVRRLACQTGVLPAVLGSRSEVLDLGRRRRLFTPAQRKALAIRDRRCRGEGCDVPAAWAEAHHKQSWSTGGATDLADGVLLCSRHHHVIHDRRYGHTWLPNGDVRFHRRT